MRIPVYEKQKSLTVPGVASGAVFRPSAQLFAENDYTRLAETVQMAQTTLEMLPKASVALGKAASEVKAFFSGASGTEKRADVQSAPFSASGKSGAEREPSPRSFGRETVLFALKEAEGAAGARKREEEIARFEQAAEAVAPLARTPENLRGVLDETLSFVPEERRADAYSRAVSANLNAALAEGETPEAAAVLAGFGEELPESVREGAGRRLAARAGERAAGEAYAKAVSSGETPSAWTDKDVKRLAAQAAASLPPVVQKETREALSVRAGAARARAERTRADLLSGVLSCAASGDEKGVNRALFSLAALNPSADETLTRAARRAAGGLREESDPARFNRLYRELDGADFDAKKLSAAFYSGKISARDYLFLEREHAAVNGGADVRTRRFVCAAAERLCRKENLTGAEAEDFKYALFSLPSSGTEKLDALKKMRDFYFL